MKKRLLAGLLSLCLMLSMVPATALALDDGTETEPVATDTTSNSATSQDDTQDSSMENDSTETGTGDENTEEAETTTGDENTAETETTTDSENTAEAETTTDSETAAEEAMVAEVGDAQYATLEAAIEAAQTDDVVKLLDDTTLKTIITIKNKSITLDMNGKTITYGATSEDAGAFIFSENSNVVICGNGTVTFDDSYLADEAASTGRMFETENNAVLTIENGTFFGGMNCILADGDSQVYIHGGSFSAYMGYDGKMWLLNRQDETNSRFFVTGGTFKDYDPYNSKTENPEENFCADGYVTTSETTEDGTIYTVETATAEADGKYYATLADAVDAVISSADKTGTVTLLKDAAGSGIGLFNSKKATDVHLTIDFGGHTYTCDDPAVGSTGTETQGFHLEKGNTVTLKNGTIQVADDSQNTIMLIQNYCDLTLEDLNLYGSAVTQYAISSNYGNMTLKNVNIDGTYAGFIAIDLMHWLNTAYKDHAPTMQINNDSENTIAGSIDVYCYGTGADTCSQKPTLTIFGGHYTVDPSEYLADGYAAVTSDKDGYIYEVVEASTPAEVVPEAPKVENNLPEDASEADRALAESISTNLDRLTVEKDIVKAAAGTVASQNTVTAEEGAAALRDAGIQVNDSTSVTIVVQSYLDVTLTNATSGEQKNFTVDITPMYRTVATTDADNIVVFGESTGTEAANAVVIGSPTELAIDKAVEVTIQLPTDFTVAKTLYVHHQKDGVTYVYEGTVANNTLTFTNPHGFSLFTITSAAPQAEIDGVHYATLQDAVNAVSNGQTITLLANGSATVSREVTFTIADGNFTADITAGSGYKLTRDGNTYTITEKSNSGGVSHPTWDGSSSSSDRYDIDKPSNVDNGSIKVSPSSRAEAGDTVTITVTPDEGYELDELVVYDADGDEVDLDDEGDGAYTLEMPKSDVEIEVSFARISDADDETPVAAFLDVADSDWYADAVQYVFANGLMAGTSDTTFSPNATTTRAMIVTILYRLEGTPAVTGTTAFTDVAAGQYYADAVAWAAQNGIVSGTSATTFSPDGVITREQMAAILYRYAQYKGYDVTAKADLSVFTDAAQVSTYATDAMAWANASGLISGTSATTLSPAGSATRAQVATILMRFCENIAK